MPSDPYSGRETAILNKLRAAGSSGKTHIGYRTRGISRNNNSFISPGLFSGKGNERLAGNLSGQRDDSEMEGGINRHPFHAISIHLHFKIIQNGRHVLRTVRYFFIYKTKMEGAGTC